VIVGKKVQLRAIEIEDLPLLVMWRNDPQTYQHFFEHEPLSLVMQERWFQSYLSRPDEKLWIIEKTDDRQPIGTIGLVRIDWRNRKAEWGRLFVYPGSERGKGYGTEALALTIRYAFDHLNLNKLYCEVYSDNERAVRLYERVGFIKEGLLRQHVYRDGAYRDALYLSLLRPEYERIRNGATEVFLPEGGPR
jgi:UDP-4-amino-4,6-dideoxy-N-acetyl-beta-L-altrosamine N-acetyltransferase